MAVYKGYMRKTCILSCKAGNEYLYARYDKFTADPFHFDTL